MCAVIASAAGIHAEADFISDCAVCTDRHLNFQSFRYSNQTGISEKSSTKNWIVEYIYLCKHPTLRNCSTGSDSHLQQIQHNKPPPHSR